MKKTLVAAAVSLIPCIMANANEVRSEPIEAVHTYHLYSKYQADSTIREFTPLADPSMTCVAIQYGQGGGISCFKKPEVKDDKSCDTIHSSNNSSGNHIN